MNVSSMFGITIDWNLAWTIAWGILLASSISSLSSLLYKLWVDNYKATILIVLIFIIQGGVIWGIDSHFLGWIWLIPGFIISVICVFFGIQIINKEK